MRSFYYAILGSVLVGIYDRARRRLRRLSLILLKGEQHG
jgi:hypothetical protein